MKSIKLAATVIWYNPDDKQIELIHNYLDSVDKLYIIDNSEDNIRRIEESNKIVYIKNKENLGIATALNKGAKNAIKDGYKWLLTLDQDSKINQDIIRKMLDFINQTKIKKIGLISPLHVVPTNEKIPNVEVEEKIEVMTSGNIINLDAYQEIGGFKDWLFIDCVDIEYGMNLNKCGHKVLRLNKVLMPHSLGNTAAVNFFGKEIICSNHNAIRRYYMIRNTLYINDLYKDIYPDYCAYLWSSQVGQIKRVIVLEKQKLKKLWYMYKGYRDYKKGVKGKLKNR